MDEELKAMQDASAALAGLDDIARGRVIRWLAERNGVVLGKGSAAPSSQGQPSATADEEEFADFFHRTGATLDKEKALAAAYWLRSHGTAQFASAEINGMLKELGYRVSNITDALSASMKEKPALIIQMKKAGTSRQARKLYKMTDAGARSIEEKLSSSKD